MCKVDILVNQLKEVALFEEPIDIHKLVKKCLLLTLYRFIILFVLIVIRLKTIYFATENDE